MKGEGEKESSVHSAQNDGAKSPPSENEGRAPGRQKQIPRRPKSGLARDDNVGLCRAEEPGAPFTPQAKTHPHKPRVGHPQEPYYANQEIGVPRMGHPEDRSRSLD